jgi:hypothetical protein
VCEEGECGGDGRPNPGTICNGVVRRRSELTEGDRLRGKRHRPFSPSLQAPSGGPIWTVFQQILRRVPSRSAFPYVLLSLFFKIY